MTIMTVRTTIGRENIVMGEIEDKLKHHPSPVKALMHPEKFKGYVLVEGEEEEIRTAISGLRHVGGLITNPVKLEDIRKFIFDRSEEIAVERGDIVEITGGPFKREKGKVQRVDAAKSEITVELLEAAIPIPVTISLDSIRLLEKSKDNVKD